MSTVSVEIAGSPSSPAQTPTSSLEISMTDYYTIAAVLDDSPDDGEQD